MKTLELASHSKINLTLEICEKRPDGYHDIDSVVQVIDLNDLLSVTKAEAGVIRVEADSPDVPAGPENSVHRACEVFFRATGVSAGARCRIRKRIPAQAGLGGGSGNAAMALIALDQLYETGLAMSELLRLGAQVGSDVPLFMIGGTVRVRGRGELVDPLPDAPPLHLVIVKPDVGVATAWAYGLLDEKRARRSPGASDSAESAVRRGDRDALVRSIWNDFDPVVTEAVPEVREIKHLLTEHGAERATLCGSGSAVFGVFRSKDTAESALGRLRRVYANVFATTNIVRGE